MSWVLDRPWLAAGLLAVAIAGAIGLGIGVATTGSKSEAKAAREQAYENAYEHSLDSTTKAAAARGLREGGSQGRVAGRRTGVVEGFDLGGGVAGLGIAEGQAAAAESARITAEAELAERQANCGSIRRAPDICPTDTELADFRAALAAAKEAEKPKHPGGGKQDQGGGGKDG